MFNKADLPYSFEEAADWQTLPNGLLQQIVWEYSLVESYQIEIEGESWPVIVERVHHEQRYQVDDYVFSAASTDEWRYLEQASEDESIMMQGHHGYWQGEFTRNGKAVLQPEAAVLLCLTPDLRRIPAYVQLIALDELRALLEDAEEIYGDHRALAFHEARPIASPEDTPDSIVDALRRMRASVGLVPTRGRAALLKFMMKTVGGVVQAGGFMLTPEEIARREALQA